MGGDGLKKQWGVDDPAKAGSDKQSREFQAAFQKEMGVVNGHLQYTSANAEAARHNPLESRRDALYPAFQTALGQIDPADASKAKGAIDKVLADIRALCGEVAKFRAEAEKARNDWQTRQPKFDTGVHQVEELEAWGDAKAAPLRGLVDGIRGHVNERRFAQACTILDQLLPKLKPIYDDYLKQKAAKPKYEQVLAEQSARLDPLKASEKPSQPMTAKAGEADAAIEQAKTKAESKDFVGGCEQMKTAQGAIDALGKLAKDPQRAKYLADSPGVEELLKAPPDTTFKTLEADWTAIVQLRDQSGPLADSGDYASANKMLADLKVKVTAYKKKLEDLKKQKQAYDDALAALQPKLTEASQSKYPRLDPLQQEMITAQTQMETAAQSEDFIAAMKALQQLSLKVDAYKKALEELEKQKKAYEDGLAELQPRLIEASKSRYAKLDALQQEMIAVQTKMEGAAQSQDYDLALKSVNELSGKVTAYEKALAEIEKQRQTYEAAANALGPKMAEVTKRQFLNLVPMQQEISKAQQDMAATAQSGDYAKALQMSKDIEGKITAYLAAAAKEVEPPIMGSAQSERADAMLKKLPAADQEKVSKLLSEAKSEPEKQYLLKGVAAGHSVQELQDFAKKIQGKDANWMRNNLSLTGSSKGTGVEQQWSQSCNATAVQAVKGQMDPLYALKLHEENPTLDQADNSDGMKMNPKLAQEQKDLLTSSYKGKASTDTSGGVAAPRSGGGSGRWADDLLNNVSDSTGVEYTTKKIGTGNTVADAMKTIDSGVSKGQPVPIVIGNSSSDYRHYVLVTGIDKGPPKRYTIHDPGSGSTVVRSEDQMKNGTLNLSGSNQLSAIEEPSAKAVK